MTVTAPAPPRPPAPRVAGVGAALAGARRRRGGRAYLACRWLAVGVFVAVVGGLVVSLFTGAAQAFAHSGVGFLWSGTWDPQRGQFGAGLLVAGTVVTTGVALVLAVPVGVGSAVFLAELAPRRLAAILSTAIDLLAAVPSIVVGLWGLLVLSPLFARDVEPALGSVPGLDWFFRGPDYGPGIVLAAVVLAVMVLPTVVALSRTALRSVPVTDREAAMALGGTRWQVVRRAALPGARSGIGAAVTLAMGRALGESIAVAMVIGNRPSLPHSLVAPGATLGSAIVGQFAEATSSLQTSSIIGLAVVLLALTVLVNVGGQVLQRRGGPATALP